MTKEAVAVVVRSASVPLTTDEVARRANLNRSTALTHLRSLRNRGLIAVTFVDGRNRWSAKDYSRSVYFPRRVAK